MRIFRYLGVCVGLFLVVILIHKVGWTPVRQTLGLLGWKYLIVLAYPLTWIVANTLGWRYACRPHILTIRFGDMVKIRLAGETFNSLLPSSYIGGEPVKAKLLSAWMPLREATSSVLIAKSAQSTGLLFYIGLGLVIGLPASATPAQNLKAWIALGLLTVGVTIFTLMLAHQSFSRVGLFVEKILRLPISPKGWPGQLAESEWLKTQKKRLASLDESLGYFYRECKERFLASTLWHGVGWVAGALELWIIFAMIGQPLTWREAWFMGVLAQLGSVIGLISPGGLGFYEGGHYVAAVLLGLPPSLAVSVSLMRRMREMFWSMVGLYFFWRFTKYPKGSRVPA